ncbi:aminotransferase class I/II-fold pyridoxal phosphate-dependent enzyme [Baekduia soli]|uniref:Aminotransferase class I/II-fold pyridoxal phosphate-dependent enzyme n=1 Tax=Baekduia soli TaxID=496014 RepID=A0A5B8U4E5_9ACTN|nr:aminotransferase class I/II-fold pyridoxal phosphate-dependent enzyme [Baekduia soli]QEC47989.1 aminotransferase class I/II-fold pyridoxal phosphate-dependent enzyme [Baekduia soli]
MRAFASDNYAGVHPEVLAAIAQANTDHMVSYGADPWTARAEELLRVQFGATAQPWLVFNGTAANVLSIGALTRSWEAVITPDSSHLHVDEAAAPERMAGVKLLTVPTEDGRLAPEQLAPLLARQGDEHAPQARVVSIANATELGTVYSLAQTRALADAAHEHGLLLHVDGSRLANAAVALGASLAEVTVEAGADVLSLGFTKNGAMGVEAVVFLHEPPPAGFAWLRKQHAQLSSKMRFMAAQVVALLEGDLWARSAAHANAMAALLAAEVSGIPGVRVSRPVQANAVFAVLPRDVADEVRARFPFYTWDERTGEVRWMCCWDTTEEDVHSFTGALRDACSATAG